MKHTPAKPYTLRSSATNWDAWREVRNRVLAALDGESGRFGRLRLHASEPAERKSKCKLSVECLDCGLGRDGSWKTYYDNVRMSPQGCPVCKCARPLIDRFTAKFPDQSLSLCVPDSGPPNVPDLRFIVQPKEWSLPDDFAWVMPSIGIAAIKKALRQHRLPGEAAQASFGDFVELLSNFKHAFPSGTLRFASRHHPETTSPGPFFDINTGTRLLRSPIAGSCVSRAAVLKAVRQESKDLKLRNELLERAEKHGATEVSFQWSPGYGGGFFILYRSRTGFYHLDTRWRAEQKAWGQSGFRRGEALALVVISHLFPALDWVRTSRPAFLLRDNGYRLELDAYSPSQRLALEYHGAHHYAPRSQSAEDLSAHADQVQRDAEKRALCAKETVRLLEMKDRPLDPAAFLSCIQDLALQAGLVPTCSNPDLEVIVARWNEICENPLEEFQQALLRNIGHHKLMSHELTQVTKGCKVTYLCGHCNKLNTAQAKGLVEGNVRQYCPQCMYDANPQQRRAEALEAWGAQGLPKFVTDRVEFDESNRYLYRCEADHVTILHSCSSALRHVSDGAFNCPTCVSVHSGVAVNHATLFPGYAKAFSDSLAELKLTIQGSPWYEEGELSARVRCPAGHERVINRSLWNRIRSNASLTDLGVVPSACPDCAYPGISAANAVKLMGTLHHRLYIMKDMYPEIRYLHGFDATGWSEETFSCGCNGPDGVPHPPFSITFRNLLRYAKHKSDQHLCLPCKLEAGTTNKRGKTLADTVSRMTILRAAVLAVTPVHLRPIAVQPPTATLITEGFGGRGEFSTTKARIRFECGVPSHAPMDASYSNYFHRFESRGYGFCPACVKNAGLTQAPMPEQGREAAGALRSIALRID
ncbi:hypothetical protein [Paraburkholderia fynbosensis]|nr:hypothetical protein [Paraburkholderia fynbosensis]